MVVGGLVLDVRAKLATSGARCRAVGVQKTITMFEINIMSKAALDYRSVHSAAPSHEIELLNRKVHDSSSPKI